MGACSMAANAQIWIGGTVGLDASKQKDINKTNVSVVFAPEFGYNINDKIAVAGALELSFNNSERKPVVYTLTPFARYTFAKAGIASFFADGGFCVGVESLKYGDGREPYGVVGFGVRPGVKVELNKHLAIEAKTGFLGYSYHGRNELHQFGFGVNNEKLSFGLVYEF